MAPVQITPSPQQPEAAISTLSSGTGTDNSGTQGTKKENDQASITVTSSTTITSTTTTPWMDPEQEARRKAEARAYALSSTTTSNKSKRKAASALSAARNSSNHNNKPTSLNIHRPLDHQQQQQGRQKMAKIGPHLNHHQNLSLQQKQHGKPQQLQDSGSHPSTFGFAALSGGDATSSAAPPMVFPGFTEDDDDYDRFVKSLLLDDSTFATLLDFDDEEDFHLSSDMEDDDDDDDDDGDEEEEEDEEDGNESENNPNDPSADKNVDKEGIAKTGKGRATTTATSTETTPSLSSPLSSSPMTLPDLDIHKDLEEELGSLLEEDLEAAVQSLMSKRPVTPISTSTPAESQTTPKATNNNNNNNNTNSEVVESSSKKAKTQQQQPDHHQESPATPLRETVRQGTQQVTYQQAQQLRRLLTRHYQLLVQQAILAVRAAQQQRAQTSSKEKAEFLAGETSDDIAEILDAAVGMLQDLDQNRKDGIRNSIQFHLANVASAKSNNQINKNKPTKGRRSLLHRFVTSGQEANEQEEPQTNQNRPLTRAAFSKTLQQPSIHGLRPCAFEIPGLINLKETFGTIDASVQGVSGSTTILDVPSHAEACRMVLRQAGANIDERYLPGTVDISENFCEPKEFFGQTFEAPCTPGQELFLRRNRNLFTSGEDNLVLRGVNLYGEKQWILIADRYLPDRSVNIISQRYSKLCLMMYKANGIYIDEKGNLEEPPKLESVDDINEEKVKELQLTTVEPPAILNVHRWSLDEDLTLLKAVPIMGHMWAELGARLIPHRDRGHLRKRYQVLERRVKATVVRNSKMETYTVKSPKATSSKTTTASSSKKGNALTSSIKPPMAKHTLKSASAAIRSGKKPSMRKQALPSTKAPKMSIGEAAASLAFLRPPRTNPVPPVASTRPPATATMSKKKALPTSRAPKRPLLPATQKTLPPVSAAVQAHLDADVSSRTAFEKLVNETNEEWSQMSKMKRMLENDDESQAADAIVSHLARSPGPYNTPSKLPHLTLDTNSMSGLSILQFDASKPAAATTTSNSKSNETSGTSIMAKVLGALKTSDTKSQGQADDKRTSGSLSPRKRPISFHPATPLPPSTPKRTNFYSSTGTPIRLSPGFRSPGVNTRNGITLTPNVTYSPAPSAVMRLMSEPSGDEIRFCDFISEDSRNQLNEDSMGGGNHDDEPKHDPTPPPLTPSKNSLMFDDMEAISALNSLSNSPFKPSTTITTTNPSTTTATESLRNNNKPKKSLFAAVVGRVTDKDPKTRLQF